MSFLTQSHQVFFGRPLCLIPSTFHVIQRLTQSLSSFHSTCPNHLNLLFLIILNNRIYVPFSSDTPLPVSRCKAVLRLSVIGLSTLQHLHYADFLSLHYVVYESISCNHGTKLNYCQLPSYIHHRPLTFLFHPIFHTTTEYYLRFSLQNKNITNETHK